MSVCVWRYLWVGCAQVSVWPVACMDCNRPCFICFHISGRPEGFPLCWYYFQSFHILERLYILPPYLFPNKRRFKLDASSPCWIYQALWTSTYVDPAAMFSSSRLTCVEFGLWKAALCTSALTTALTAVIYIHLMSTNIIILSPEKWKKTGKN